MPSCLFIKRENQSQGHPLNCKHCRSLTASACAHHIACFKVPDIKEALSRFRKMGIDILQSGRSDEVEFYYLDTEKTLGAITEIVKDGKIRPPDSYFPVKDI